MKRQIIRIDEEKCDGCGLCVPNCPEGALRIVDGKAKLVSDIYCDGLGACVGHCPRGAITVEEREAEEYDEQKVMDKVIDHGQDAAMSHLHHLQEHGQISHIKEAIRYLIERELDIPDMYRLLHEGHAGGGGERVNQGAAYTPEKDTAGGRERDAASCSCPGSRVVDLREREKHHGAGTAPTERHSELRQWPIQIKLVPPFAPYLQGCDLLVAADCVPFAYAGFHGELLQGKTLLVGCPKLDDAAYYVGKLAQTFRDNDIRSVTVAHMEVPCCGGLERIVRSALDTAGKDVPVSDVTVSISGEIR